MGLIWPSIIALLALCLTIGYVQSLDFTHLVPPSLRQCCGDSGNRNCRRIDAATKGPGSSGFHYVFLKDKVMRIRIRGDGFPEVTEDSPGELFGALGWFGNLNQTLSLAAFLYEDAILIKRGAFFYRVQIFDASQNNGTFQRRLVTPATDCKAIHSALCPQNHKQLIAATSSFVRGVRLSGVMKPSVSMFYYDPTREDFEEVVFNEKSGEPVAEMFMNKKIRAMSDMTIYKEEYDIFNDVYRSHFLLFEPNGYVCPFVRGRTEDIRDGDIRPPYTPINCIAAQVFAGCPQSWCQGATVDDVVLTAGLTRDERRLFVYRGHYHFEAAATVPVPVPRFSQMQLSHSLQGDANRRHPHIDAAVELLVGRGLNFKFFFKDMNVFVHDSPTGTPKRYKVFDVFPGLWQVLLGQDSSDIVDAAVHTLDVQQIFLFSGTRYAQYGYETDGDEDNGFAVRFFNLGQGYIRQAFPGLSANIDGAVAIDGIVYIFEQNWIYKQPENALFTKSVVWSPELSYFDRETRRGFFSVDGLCGFTDDTIATLNAELIQPKPIVDRVVDTAIRTSTIVSWRWIETVAVLVACSGALFAIAAFWHCGAHPKDIHDVPVSTLRRWLYEVRLALTMAEEVGQVQPPGYQPVRIRSSTSETTVQQADDPAKTTRLPTIVVPEPDEPSSLNIITVERENSPSNLRQRSPRGSPSRLTPASSPIVTLHPPPSPRKQLKTPSPSKSDQGKSQ